MVKFIMDRGCETFLKFALAILGSHTHFVSGIYYQQYGGYQLHCQGHV